jgi:hypothetical protein
MHAVLLILILLIDTSPADLIIGEPFAPGIAAAVMALAIGIIAFTLRRRDAEDMRRFFRPVLIGAGVPAGWMLVQMAPIVNLGWAHPVWQSAATVLGGPIVGALTIDRGLTSTALCNYIVAVAIMFVAALVAVDRHRAKWILLALSGATTLIALIVAIQDFAGIDVLSDLNGRLPREAAIDGAALGAILCVAAAACTLDGSKRQRSIAEIASSPKVPLIASLVAFAVCASAVVCLGTPHALFAMASGLVTFLALAASRHFRLSSWGIAGIASSMILIASAIVASQARTSASDPTLSLADAPESFLSITQRILADGTWTGSGAGTFQAIAPIYKDPSDPIKVTAPTLAANIVVELGRPALWSTVVVAFFGIVLLLRGALARLRDWFYPATGASCLCTAVLLGFSNIGLSATTNLIIVASTLGLAFGQSQRRTSSQRLSGGFGSMSHVKA